MHGDIANLQVKYIKPNMIMIMMGKPKMWNISKTAKEINSRVIMIVMAI